MSDQLDSGEAEEVDGTEGVEEKDKVEQRVPATTTTHEEPLCTSVGSVAICQESLRTVEEVFSDPSTYHHNSSSLTLSNNYWYGPRTS